jgi:hypothetical protein
MFIRFNIKGNIFDIIADICTHLHYNLDIYITKFIIPNTGCGFPIITKHHKKIIQIITIATVIRHYIITNKLENLLANELKLNKSLQESSNEIRYILPNFDRLIELNKYHKIIKDYCIELYSLKKLIKTNFNNTKKKSIEMIEFHISIAFLIKRLYKNLMNINNLNAMLITNPNEININIYKQLIEKYLYNKELSTISCIYKEDINI